MVNACCLQDVLWVELIHPSSGLEGETIEVRDCGPSTCDVSSNIEVIVMFKVDSEGIVAVLVNSDVVLVINCFEAVCTEHWELSFEVLEPRGRDGVGQ